MAKGNIIVGCGLAMVDEKIYQDGVILPSPEELAQYADQHSNTVQVAGGVTPNIITTLSMIEPNAKVRMVATVGRDRRGKLYRSQTPNRLGALAVDSNNDTGLVVSAVDTKGVVYQRQRNLGAAEHIRIPAELDPKSIKMFMSDLTTVRLPKAFDQIDRILPKINNGDYFLNLAGLNPAIAPPQQVKEMLNSSSREPDIVTGNEDEFNHLTNSGGFCLEAAVKTFPNTTLLVITRAALGSVIRYQDEIYELPPTVVPNEKVVDETGAGDTYAGIMLGYLITRKRKHWTTRHILLSCLAASYGASLAVQTNRTRINKKEVQSVSDQLSFLNKFAEL
ncbi:MAG: carbohydrate kinase family protein [Candidatus Saccharimonadales bacterium]